MLRRFAVGLLLSSALFGTSTKAQSPFLLLGVGSPISCAQGSAYVAAAQAVDGTFIGSMYEMPIRQLICAIQTLLTDCGVENVFSVLDAFYILDNNTPAARAINVVNPGTHNLVSHGSPVCGTGGCSGTDLAITTDYFDTGIVPPVTNYNLGNVPGAIGGVFAWSNSNITPTLGGVSVGIGTGAACTAGAWINPKNSAGNFTMANATAGMTVSAVATSVGFFGGAGTYEGGTNITEYAIMDNNVNVFVNKTYSAALASSFTILGCHNGAAVYNGEPRKIGVVGIGTDAVVDMFNDTTICHIINVYETQVSGTASVC